eukprot:4647535-Pyramimonas_sp.AAC.1
MFHGRCVSSSERWRCCSPGRPLGPPKALRNRMWVVTATLDREEYDADEGDDVPGGLPRL